MCMCSLKERCGVYVMHSLKERCGVCVCNAYAHVMAYVYDAKGVDQDIYNQRDFIILSRLASTCLAKSFLDTSTSRPLS